MSLPPGAAASSAAPMAGLLAHRCRHHDRFPDSASLITAKCRIVAAGSGKVPDSSRKTQRSSWERSPGREYMSWDGDARGRAGSSVQCASDCGGPSDKGRACSMPSAGTAELGPRGVLDNDDEENHPSDEECPLLRCRADPKPADVSSRRTVVLPGGYENRQETNAAGVAFAPEATLLPSLPPRRWGLPPTSTGKPTARKSSIARRR